MTSDADRAFAFQRWVLESTSTRTQELPWGTAFFHNDFPKRYDANMVLCDRALGRDTVVEVDHTMERLFGDYVHREIEVRSEPDANRLAMGLAERGYAMERLVVMALRRPPDREGTPDVVEEVDLDTLRPLFLEITRREPWGTAPGIAEMLADFRRVLVDGIGARFFTQRVDGTPAGSCELYVHGDVAQIEDVGTLEEFRGRGIARNVVLRAADEARAAGASLIFLFADAEDWPRQLYDRLGFDEIARSRLFTRWPPGEAPFRPSPSIEGS
jgi:ribosomal protein S18 acetylase RimI-like enzyme